MAQELILGKKIKGTDVPFISNKYSVNSYNSAYKGAFIPALKTLKNLSLNIEALNKIYEKSPELDTKGKIKEKINEIFIKKQNRVKFEFKILSNALDLFTKWDINPYTGGIEADKSFDKNIELIVGKKQKTAETKDTDFAPSVNAPKIKKDFGR